MKFERSQKNKTGPGQILELKTQVNRKIKILVISDYRDTTAIRPEAEIFIRLQLQGKADVTIMTYEKADYIKRFQDVGIRVIPFHPEKKLDCNAVKFIRQELIDGQYDV